MCRPLSARHQLNPPPATSSSAARLADARLDPPQQDHGGRLAHQRERSRGGEEERALLFCPDRIGTRLVASGGAMARAAAAAAPMLQGRRSPWAAGAAAAGRSSDWFSWAVQAALAWLPWHGGVVSASPLHQTGRTARLVDDVAPVSHIH